jgi:hypothetical protein
LSLIRKNKGVFMTNWDKKEDAEKRWEKVSRESKLSQ